MKQCQTTSERMNRQMHQESHLVHLALKCDIWCNNFNDFPENQLKKNCIYRLIPDFIPLNILSRDRAPFSHRTNVPDRHKD